MKKMKYQKHSKDNMLCELLPKSWINLGKTIVEGSNKKIKIKY